MNSNQLLQAAAELIRKARLEACILHPYAAEFDLLATSIEQALNTEKQNENAQEI